MVSKKSKNLLLTKRNRQIIKEYSAMLEMLEKVALQNALITAFAAVGIVVLLSSKLSRRLTFGRVHGSAIAIVIGLGLAYWGGTQTGGHKGLADMSLFGGIGLMGGVSLLLGTVLPFIVGASIARAFGYSDAVSMTTIGAGAVTYIVGPVTGAAIGASSDVIALSIATGVIKSILVM